MNKSIKVIVYILVVIFSCLCFGCGASENENDTNYSEQNIVEVKDTNYKFVESGETDYRIVIPNNATEYEQYAANELAFFLEASTGIRFSTVKESNAPSDKYISVGQTNLLNKAGVRTDDEKLGASGYVIKTKGKNVFLSGREDLGTIYAVYGFLKEQVGYTYYSYDCIKYDQITSVNLKDFDVVDIPSFANRRVTTRNIWDYDDRSKRLRVEKPYTDDISSLGHSAQYIIDYETYGAQHPDWFATTTCLCYSAGEELENEVVEYYKNLFSNTEQKSGKVIAFFGQSDDDGYCKCEKCTAAVAKYGSITATMIQFFNHVSEKIQPWLDANQPNRELIFMFYAYKWSQSPPVQYNEKTKQYVYSQDVVMRDNVGVLFAPIYMNYNYPIDSEENIEEKRAIEGWAKLTKNLGYYGYYVNFAYPMYLYNNFDKQIIDYKYLEKLGACYVMEQDMTWVDGWQTFSAYKNYITSNLMWNVQANQRELTVDFFNNYYREGAEYLLKYFDEWRAQYSVLLDKYDMQGTCYEKMDIPEYWPMSLLEKWIGYTDKALEAIEKYKATDKDLYDRLYNHIMIEKTSLQYQMIDIYGSAYYKVSELDSVKKEVWKNMEMYCMVTNETSSSYSNLLALASKWGIKVN